MAAVPRATVMMNAPLRIAHVSDPHFGTEVPKCAMRGPQDGSPGWEMTSEEIP